MKKETPLKANKLSDLIANENNTIMAIRCWIDELSGERYASKQPKNPPMWNCNVEYEND